MSRLHKLVPLLGGLLLSKGGRRVAGRHAGKLALATLAYEVWRNRREGARPKAASPTQNQAQNQARPQPRTRWSGRSPR
ncbi:MAG: cysteine protease [Brevundimonas sp.]|uniref:cysteine protease n=1 Tax=Brevundimonas sp. TaxID=1871086 RepID=UPI0028D6B592|nr:cysteine protease [uncultured Brevundimonas sp.]